MANSHHYPTRLNTPFTTTTNIGKNKTQARSHGIGVPAEEVCSAKKGC